MAARQGGHGRDAGRATGYRRRTDAPGPLVPQEGEASKRCRRPPARSSVATAAYGRCRRRSIAYGHQRHSQGGWLWPANARNRPAAPARPRLPSARLDNDPEVPPCLATVSFFLPKHANGPAPPMVSTINGGEGAEPQAPWQVGHVALLLRKQLGKEGLRKQECCQVGGSLARFLRAGTGRRLSRRPARAMPMVPRARQPDQFHFV
jgi:hypothetical protein